MNEHTLSGIKTVTLRIVAGLVFFLLLPGEHDSLHAQTGQLWHGIERELRYRPEGNDIVITNGTKRFTRALYGGNTAFRAEAGDLPEFALYMPGMGGNLQFGIIAGNKSKWLIRANHIKAIYRPGSMLYEIRDSLLGGGILHLTAIALYGTEGLVVQVRAEKIPAGVELVAVYGGATGKKFSRDGDIGADPESSFYLKPEYCGDNIYRTDRHSFSLLYGFSGALTEDERYELQHLPAGDKRDDRRKAEAKRMTGTFPPEMTVRIADANTLQSPAALVASESSAAPVVMGKMAVNNNRKQFFYIGRQESDGLVPYDSLDRLFNNAELQRQQLAGRIRVHTPDPYINTLGSVLGIAADAIWESPSFLHGAVAWRMRLNGWRGAYAGDVLGWHDRARLHFNAYAASQLTAPPVTGVVMDTALHLARHLEKTGTAPFSKGYIARNPNDTGRAHHYDMNLVFIDQLLNHFNYTGDIAYIRAMWPVITRHLEWEKRNFDADNDGLYDSYAAIWASDALQYSGGGVTHASAYNYRANKAAARLAGLIGEQGTPYEQEADRIIAAINENLWLPKNGWYAEYRDLQGNRLVHDRPAIWTIYHALDEGIADPLRAYQSLCYMDQWLPHIPVRAKGLPDTSLYVLATSDWQPYTWSLNNVALAENLHASLAGWQGNRPEEAFTLWKSALLESMYLGSSPGNIQQLSFYDAMRGELYRDFADPIAMAARSLTEGLFGIRPDALQDTLLIQPGFPSGWNEASLHTPDIEVDFRRSGNRDRYTIRQPAGNKLNLAFIIPFFRDGIEKITIDGIAVSWQPVDAIGTPLLRLQAGKKESHFIEIAWKGNAVRNKVTNHTVTSGKPFSIPLSTSLLQVLDPQTALKDGMIRGNKLEAVSADQLGYRTFFIKTKQGMAQWWQPVSLMVLPALQEQEFFTRKTTVSVHTCEKVDLSAYFNDKVTHIFQHRYLSPRPASPTLQLPVQGIGNWAYPLVTAVIDDSGLRRRAKANNEIRSIRDIPFFTPSDSLSDNIIFTSQWDNFPDSVSVLLSGNASRIYMLMAGSTNPMQSRVTNGRIVVAYTDGTTDSFLLRNPDNWWPIEQDYYTDGFAFTAGLEMPERLYLKEGIFRTGLPAYTSIKGFSNRVIDGGAATLLGFPLEKNKTLHSLTVHAVANDVVIGLMAVTLQR